MRTADLRTASDADWAEAHRREKIIRPLALMTRVPGDVAAKAMVQLELGRARFHKLLQLYRASPAAASLLPRPRGREKGEQRLSAAAEHLIARGIAEFYLTLEKPSVQALRRWLRHEGTKIGVKVPSTKAIQARLARLAPQIVTARRQGAKSAADKWEPTRGVLEADYALELVQSDHTLVDVIVVDDLYRKPIGRPWLTLMIDVASRTVPGFHLHMLAPSAVSVGMCMRHAVLPKRDWLAERSMKAPWDSQGLMDRLHLDNAREHRSDALKRGCRAHSIAVEYRPVRRPHFGGHIERLIGTMMGAVHLLPGTTFSNVAERGDYDAEGEACMTLSELEVWLAAQIIGPYHAERHRGIGIPPALAWAEGVERRPELVRLPADDAAFLFDFLPCELRAVTPHGIELFRTHYWDDALSCWYTRPGQTMPVRWDPRDLSRVWLELPHGEHLEVPYRDLRRPAITRWEQREAVRTLRERGQQAVDETLIFQAVETQRLIVAEAAHKTKAARLALQRTKAALRDARRARGGSKRRLEQVTPAVGASAVEERTDGDQKVLPYLVEEMPR